MAGAAGDPVEGGPQVPVAEAIGKGRTLRADAWRRLRKNKLAVAGLVWIFIMILLAVTADLWVPRYLGDPVDIDTTEAASQSLQPPSRDHPLGTDRMSRDITSRIIYGARASLLVGVVAVGIMLVIGLVMGAVAAYYGGIWDSIIMRTADIFFAFPYVLFAVVLVGVMGGGGLANVFFAIGLLGWPSIARVFRGSILSVRENEYVDAARAMGASTPRILFRHIMPNAIAPIVVYATMSIGAAILAEAALSFLGMGVQPPAPSWGGMLSEARGYLFTAPWLMVYPGIAILTTVLAFVLLGDGFRDALDVKMKE
ncbi:MAG: ABC transporter permease [Thermoleophilia bacterium]|nr:ABC transporter permease [Thermoleophilia bacterium]